MITMPVRKQPVESETIDPVLAAKRNRDLIKVTAAIVALSIIVVLAAFFGSQPTSLPMPYMP